MIIFGVYGSNLKNSNILNHIIKSDYFGKKNIYKFITNNTVIYIENDVKSCYKVYPSKHTLIVGDIASKEIDIKEYLASNDTKNIAQDFINKFYGSYLIFNEEDAKLAIIRDPVGQLPIFHTKLESGLICFSNQISVLLELTDTKLAFNWDYIACFLIHTFITSPSTAFQKINELPHGCMITFEQNDNLPKITAVWDPLNFCHNKNYNEEHFLRQIFDTLYTTTQNLIGETESNILLDFSGGLDSSALLLLLSKIYKDPNQIIALNMYHSDVGSSDERLYARTLASKVGSNFIEFDHALHLPLSPIDNFYLQPNWPTSNLNHLKIENDISKIASTFDTEKFISGHGGDHIFLCPPPIESIYDYIFYNGFNELGSKIKQISSMGRIPFAQILTRNSLAAFKHKLKFKYSRESIFSPYVPWITQDIITRSKRIKFHPLFDKDTSSILPGKFAQLENIFTGLSTIKSTIRSSQRPIIYPLFSQPMIELCLKMPTDSSYHHGFNRYPFRKAIESKFGNIENLWRKDKGETTGITQLGIKHNKDYIMELCLEGKCIKYNLIESKNRSIIHKAINDMMEGKPDYLWPINNLVALEIFFSLWE